MQNFARRYPVVTGGLVAAALDIAAAFAMSWPRVPPARVLQYIASGLLGPAAFRGGAATAGLGLLLHTVIACSAATVYYGASRWWPVLVRRPIACGAAYGITVYAAMQLVVLPLSRVSMGTTSWQSRALPIAVHIICVGLPIALAARAARRTGPTPTRQSSAADHRT